MRQETADSVPEAGAEWPLKQRLADALQGRLRECGAQSRLIEEIEQANNNVEGLTIERRKLAKILSAAGDVKLSTRELQALDAYFLRGGSGGLGAIIASERGVLRTLANTRRIAFLVGAKPSNTGDGTVGGTNNISSWDLRSVAHLLRAVDSLAPGVHFQIEDVLLRTPAQVGTNEPVEDMFRGESWHQLIHQRGGPSLISLGSPRANHASECLLAEMFGITPFTAPRNASNERRPPFKFGWASGGPPLLPSRFSANVPELSGDVGRTRHYYAAVQMGDKTALVEHGTASRDEYGVVACQLRPDGRVFLCLAGLTGPSTYAAAQVLDTPSLQALPGEPPHSPVCWVLVTTRVALGGESGGDTRIITRSACVTVEEVAKLFHP